MSQEPPPLAPRIAEDDSDDEDPVTELDAAGDTRRRIIDGIIQPARTAGGPDSMTTRVFYSELLLHRSAFGTRCIDSNLESGRHT